MPMKPCAHPGCGTLVAAGTHRCPVHHQEYRRERWQQSDAARSSAPGRSWYKLVLWTKHLRPAALTRALWRCQWPGCGVQLRPGRQHPHSAVVDHILPHRGDWRLFCDPANHRALCKRHHDAAKQAEERAAADERG